ncbi:MAG: pilus assembly protein [Dehalococcoidia bacterium]|nr:pilus assembly protein [Dehalococcoidia bacterium]
MSCWRHRSARGARGAHPEGGAALVEMAVIMPLLLLMVMGVGDLGRVMYTAITLSHAARAGAAYGAQSNGHTGDAAGIQQAAEEEAQNIGTIGVTSQRICECTGGSPVSCTTASCGSYGPPRAFVEVTATQTYATLIAYPGIPSTVPLSRTAKVRVQ